MLKLVVLSVFLLTVCVYCEDEVVKEVEDKIDGDDDEFDDVAEAPKAGAPPPGSQSMSFSQPSLTEEEQKSHHFPSRYRCEACQIVVHNLGTDFRTAETKIPKKKKKRTLGDIEIMETVEDVCVKEKFDSYSIQEFGGKVTFKGPAFPDRTSPGMSMGGGLWPVRYTNYCGDLLEEYSEDEVYAFYRQGNLFYELCLRRQCKGQLTETPASVDFQHTLTPEEQICKQDGVEGKCPNKSDQKVEL